jgi:NADH-quinone oxidoreductase subunit N
MSWEVFAPLSLDLLLACGILLLLVVDLIAPRLGRGTAHLTVAILFGVLAASFVIDTSGTSVGGAYQGGPWPLLFKRIFLIAGIIATLGSTDHVAQRYPTRQGEYYMLLLFSLLGMTLLPGTQDLILLLVCFELMSTPLYILAAYDKNDRHEQADLNHTSQGTPEGSLKLYLVSITSTAITLFGISLLYGMAQTTQISALGAGDPTPLASLGMLLVLAGLGFKIGVAPFHMWVPDTYQGSGTPFVSLLSVAPKLAGFAVLSLIFISGLSGWSQEWVPVMVGLSLVTIIVGNLLALPQTHIIRLLALSGVAQIGYMLMAFATLSAEGLGVVLFYAAGYTATNMGAFLVAQALYADGGDHSIDSFDGLAQRAPGLALAMLLFLLSLAGIPFVVGFWGKLYVFLTAWRAGFGWLVVIGAVAAVVALFYYLQVARAMYMKPPPHSKSVSIGGSLKVAIWICLAFVVGMGVWPKPFIEAANDAVAPFFASIDVDAGADAN